MFLSLIWKKIHERQTLEAAVNDALASLATEALHGRGSAEPEPTWFLQEEIDLRHRLANNSDCPHAVHAALS